MLILLSFLFACGDKETTLQCTEDVLQECDADGSCTDVEDCAAADQICHDMGEDSHCMDAGEMDDTGMDTGMEM
jgi:hypothetical protein